MGQGYYKSLGSFGAVYFPVVYIASYPYDDCVSIIQSNEFWTTFFTSLMSL